MMIREDLCTIAVDFDGTIVEHDYPRIGKEMLFAFDTLKALQRKGHKLILWTFRTGDSLREAVEYCRNNGLEFYAVNRNYPEEKPSDNMSRKIQADIFIDDRNLGGFPGWSKVWQTLYPDGENFEHVLTDPNAHYNYQADKGLLKRIKKLLKN